ncbi:diguanylate cyclase [Deinococcus petrolearius]|uniref:Diguanylate cyclase n=1 Tax=Deinococcus petrolearius TaxID=1751295 RepID=A0ABW1DEF3_9DEIO
MAAQTGGIVEAEGERRSLLETAWRRRDVAPETAALTARAALKSPDAARAQVILAYLDARAGRYGLSAGRLVGGLTVSGSGDGPRDVWWGRSLNALANLHSLLNQPEEAAALFDQQLRLGGELGDTALEAGGLHDLGAAHLRAGDPARATCYLSRALPLLEQLGDAVGVAGARLGLGAAALRAGRPQEATGHLRQALEALDGPDAPPPGLESRVRRTFLEAADALGDPALIAEQEAALRRLTARLDPGHPESRLETALDIGLALSRRAGPPATLELLWPVLALARQLGRACHAGLGPVHERLGEARAALGDHEGALEHLRAALELERAGHAAERRQRDRALEVLRRSRVPGDPAEQERQENRQLRADLRDLQTLNEHMRRLSLTDGLTGLYNRYHLFLEGARLAARASLDAPLGVAIIDIDHFKRINDRHGHLPGDEVLRTLARLIRDYAQPGDLTARYGGEEFVLLRPGWTASAFAASLQNLRRAVGTFDWEGVAPGLRVTVSIGVAETCTPDFEQVLGAADRCLYHVKNTGRDAVCHHRSAGCAPS